ncbi:MAG: hypothetical protein P1U88_22600, partial [Thalassobaculaceae bacterium]|nr:hypothetical protein [Thalassobaculaceae bacterium]
IGSPGWSRVRDRTLDAVWDEIGDSGHKGRFVATNVVTQDHRGSLQFDGWRQAALRAGLNFTWVTLVCDREENLRRLKAPGRKERGSLVAPSVLEDLRKIEDLFEPAPNSRQLSLNITRLPVDQAVAALQSSV